MPTFFFLPNGCNHPQAELGQAWYSDMSQGGDPLSDLLFPDEGNIPSPLCPYGSHQPHVAFEYLK